MRRSTKPWRQAAAAMAAFAASSLLIGGAAQAASVTTYDPKSLTSALTEAGYKAKMTRDEDDKSPFIESAAGGEDISIAFSGCTKGEDCDQIEFVAVWTCKDEMKVCADAALKWNEDENYSHAVMTGGGVALYYHLLFDKTGISPALFVRNFEMFAGDMGSFIDLVIKTRGE